MNRAEIGRQAEELAAAFLQAKGMTIVERKFRNKLGEIDLIVKDGEEIVFVEVRARATTDFGGAAASVLGPKSRRVVRAAKSWIHFRGYEGPCRFDVVALEGGRLEHIPAAFDAS